MKQTLADQVDHTCQELTRRQMPITFAAVAESLGISRSTLYRNPGLRALVDASRQRDRASELTVSGVAVQVDQLRLVVETMAATLRRHETVLKRLDSTSTSARTLRSRD
jgi:hypothetical protein